MKTVKLRNTGSIPIAIPKCPRIEPNTTGEVPFDLFERYKNNPSVKNWLGTGRLVILEGAEAPVKTPEPPPDPTADAVSKPGLTDEQIEDILSGSAKDALQALEGASTADIERALTLEADGKARVGLTADLTEMLSNGADG